MLTVKKLALSTLISSSLLFYPALQASAETPQHVVKQPAGGYSVQVGDVLVTSFTTGPSRRICTSCCAGQRRKN
jgi:hypothetical protein